MTRKAKQRNTMTRKETQRRLILLRNLVRKHKGFENSISTKEIISQMKEYGFDIHPRALPKMIAKVREEFYLPISYERGKGYFMAVKKEDFEKAIKDMEMQVNALLTHINFLQSFKESRDERNDFENVQ